MPARAIPEAEIERLAREGAAQLRRERSASAPKVINTEHALALGSSVPVLWNGTEYRARDLSFRDGLQLERAKLWIEQMAKQPATTPEELEEAEAELIQTLALLHSLLEDTPEVNPFADASPSEVGALVGFFKGCLMMQSSRSRLAMVRRPSTTN